jgi:glycosyltransferase involved in cell wall biosynthesis
MAEGTVAQRAGYHARRHTAERAIDRLVDEHGLQIAHFHFFATEFGTLMRIARESGLGIVTTFHGADVNERLVNPATRATVESIARQSDQVTVVSRTLQERLLHALPELESRVSLVPNVVPTSFANATDDEEPTRWPKWDVLLVGQLIHRKGGDILLDAMARVRRHIPDARVAFAGVGAFEPELRAQAARLGIESQVEFLGELPREAAIAAYRNSRVIAIPSRSEGLPLVLLEAQWLGIPVVGSAVDGLQEAIQHGENGLLVPPEDSDALAAAITLLLSDHDAYTAIGACARSRALERFAPQVMVRRFAKVYSRAYRLRSGVARPA